MPLLGTERLHQATLLSTSALNERQTEYTTFLVIQSAATRMAHDEACRQHHLAGLQLHLAIQPAEKQLSSIDPHIVSGLGDNCEEWKKMRDIGKIVKGDQGDILGDT